MTASESKTQNPKKPNWAKTIGTPLTIASSVVVIATGLIMYLIFKNHTLEEMHGSVGLVLVAGVLLHIVAHWRSFCRYFEKTSNYLSLVPVLIAAAFVFLEPDSKGGGLNPKLIFAQLEKSNVDTVSLLFKTNSQDILEKMKADGLVISDLSNSIRQIAETNKKSPKEILNYFVTKTGN